MNLKTAFNILDQVRIVAIDVIATVLKIQYDGVGVIYQLEYWWNCEIRSVWLYERELVACVTDRQHQSIGPKPMLDTDVCLMAD